MQKIQRVCLTGVFLMLFMVATLAAQGVARELRLLDGKDRMRGSDVEFLQKYLLWQGIDLGKDGIDGWFGGDTDKAVRRWQKLKGKSQTGRVKLSDLLPKMHSDFKLTQFLNPLPATSNFMTGDYPSGLAAKSPFGSWFFEALGDGWQISLKAGVKPDGRTVLMSAPGEYFLSNDQRYLVVIDTPNATGQRMQAIAIVDLLTEQAQTWTAWDKDSLLPLPQGTGVVNSCAIDAIAWAKDGFLFRLQIDGEDMGVYLIGL